MIYIDKNDTLGGIKDHYTSDYEDHNEWCQYCVHYCEHCNNPYRWCSKGSLTGSVVNFCGHCDKFSNNGKINPLKQWLLEKSGFEFKNKVVEEIPEEKKRCFYCKRFFCTEYHYPRHRMVCSGILPKWDWLYFLMREVKATDCCKKFVMNKIFKEKKER